MKVMKKLLAATGLTLGMAGAAQAACTGTGSSGGCGVETSTNNAAAQAQANLNNTNTANGGTANATGGNVNFEDRAFKASAGNAQATSAQVIGYCMSAYSVNMAGLFAWAQTNSDRDDPKAEACRDREVMVAAAGLAWQNGDKPLAYGLYDVLYPKSFGKVFGTLQDKFFNCATLDANKLGATYELSSNPYRANNYTMLEGQRVERTQIVNGQTIPFSCVPVAGTVRTSPAAQAAVPTPVAAPTTVTVEKLVQDPACKAAIERVGVLEKFFATAKQENRCLSPNRWRQSATCKPGEDVSFDCVDKNGNIVKTTPTLVIPANQARALGL